MDSPIINTISSSANNMDLLANLMGGAGGVIGEELGSLSGKITRADVDSKGYSLSIILTCLIMIIAFGIVGVSVTIAWGAMDASTEEEDVEKRNKAISGWVFLGVTALLMFCLMYYLFKKAKACK